MRQDVEPPEAPTVEARYGSVADIAAYSSLSEKFIRNLIDSGRLKSHKLGRRILISFTDFDSYVESQSR